MSASLISSKSKAVLDASCIATCTTLQDDLVQCCFVDSYPTNCSAHKVVNGNRFQPTTYQSTGISPEKSINVKSPTLHYNTTSPNSASISISTFDDGSTRNANYEESPEVLTSASQAPCIISKRKRSRRGTDLVGPVTEITTLTGPATFVIPEDVTHGYSVCVTQKDAEREVRVGWKGYATRWKKDSMLKYTVCTESFENSRWAALVAGETLKAIAMWQDIGVRFKRVKRDERATFAIKYCFEPDNCRPDVYARAFFPKTSRGELLIYQLALEPSNVDFLANILAHELGHILGLSHEFTDQTSFLWGKNNDRSVMNYFSDLNQLQVGQQDREELASYYQCDAGQYKGLTITDIEPGLYQFPRSDKSSVRRHRSASKRLYLNYRTRRFPFPSQSVINPETRPTAKIFANLVVAYSHPLLLRLCALGLLCMLCLYSWTYMSVKIIP